MWLLKLGVALAALCAVGGETKTDKPAEQLTQSGEGGLEGPNVCGSHHQTYCCPGWKRLTGGNQCVVPVCESDCLNGGRCVAPNRCVCTHGFTGPQCEQDIDECMDSPDICGGGLCINTPGEYRCLCPDGFMISEDMKACLDVDECDLNPDICLSGDCENTRGSFVCHCDLGYSVGKGKTGCTDKLLGNCYMDVRSHGNASESLNCSREIGVGVSQASCCCSMGVGWGSPCEACPPHNSSEYKSLCPGGPGFQHNPYTFMLEDIDECRHIPGVCRNGVCVNMMGGFRCECPMGFHYNDNLLICEDIDECRHIPGVCRNGVCVNMMGGVRCECPMGFRYNDNLLICEVPPHASRR